METSEQPPFSPDQAETNKDEFDSFGLQIESEMRQVFPTYATVDRAQWGSFEPDPNASERRLRFYQGDIGERSPQIVFIEKKNQDFAINFHKNPLYKPGERITQPGGTIYNQMYRGNGPYWPPNDVNLMTEGAKIWLEGIPLRPEVVDQPTFILGDTNDIVSIRTFINSAQEYKDANAEAKKKDKIPPKQMELAMRQKFQAKNIYTVAKEEPDLMKSLAVRRLSFLRDKGLPFIMRNTNFDANEIITEIERNSVLGQRALALEAARSGIYHELLWQSAVIRPGASSQIVIANE